MSKHTQGEWKINDNAIVAGEVQIATVAIGKANTPYIQIMDEEKANAKLIAAAPDMLDTLKRITVMTNPSNEKWIEEVLDIVQAAIKKATI